MMRATAAVFVFVLAVPSSVLAQAAAAGRPETVRTVRLSSTAFGESIEREMARLARDTVRASEVQSLQPPQRSWAGRHPIAMGMMIGLGGGIACGAAQEYEGRKLFGPFVALGAGVGLGVGAGVGAIISAARR